MLHSIVSSPLRWQKEVFLLEMNSLFLTFESETGQRGLGPKNFPVKFFPPGLDACMNVHGQGPRAHYLITFKPMIRRSPCTFLQYSSGSMTGGDRAARQFVSSTEKGID